MDAKSAIERGRSFEAHTAMEEGDRDSPVFRDSGERPIFKLSVKLIDTYKNINKVRLSDHRNQLASLLSRQAIVFKDKNLIPINWFFSRCIMKLRHVVCANKLTSQGAESITMVTTIKTTITSYTGTKYSQRDIF